MNAKERLGKVDVGPPQPLTPLGRQTKHEFEPLLNDHQASAMLGGIHPKTLQRLARTSQIPAYRLGRFWRYRASELDNWLRSKAQSAGQPVGVDFTKENAK